MKNPKIQEAITLLGGPVATQKKLQLDNYQTAQQWVVAGVVPAKYCKKIQVILNDAITCQDLRPNDWQMYWPELEKAA